MAYESKRSKILSKESKKKIPGKLFLEYDNQRQIDINHTWKVKMRQLST